MPVTPESVTPVQSMEAMLFPPVAVSSAVTVPVTGAVLNQRLLPSGDPPFGAVRAMLTVGGAFGHVRLVTPPAATVPDCDGFLNA